MLKIKTVNLRTFSHVAVFVVLIAFGQTGLASAAAVDVTEFSTGITTGAGPGLIVIGSDGNLWFTGGNIDSIGRITPSGTVTEFSTGITASSFHLQSLADLTVISGSLKLAQAK